MPRQRTSVGTAARSVRRQKSPSARTERPAVLIVDDDADTRVIFTQYLRMMGCATFSAPDGRTAVDKARDLCPDIIIMDLAMPWVDGWEAIRELRSSSWTQRIPIIAISAVPMSRDGAFDAGCDAYLSKPCTPDVLWAQIRALLRLGD